MASPFIIMLNPKTLELVQVFKQARGSAGYRMSLLSNPRVCIANCWTDGTETVTARGDDYVRVHSAGACGPRDAADFMPLDGVSDGYKGKGYGMLVYAAAAVGSKSRRFDGVFSPKGGPNHNRSRDADKLWESMVDKGLSEEEEVEGDDEEEEDTREHCESIPSGTYADRDDEWYITDDEVCGQVNVVRSTPGSFEVNLLKSETVLEQPFVLWSDDGEEVDGPPGDLLVRVHVADPKTASAVLNLLRKYEDGDQLVQAFMGRAEVAALFGQQQLFGPQRRVGLPPISRATRDLLDLFDDMP